MFTNPFQRSLLLIGAALALPIIVLIVLQVSFSLNRERQDIERATLNRVEQVNMLADARVESDFAAMSVLATAAPFQRRDWASAYARAGEVAALNPHWRNVTLHDSDTGAEIFDLSKPFRAAIAGPPHPPGAPGAHVGGVRRDGPGCPCVALTLRLPQAPRYVLTVSVTTDVFQAILISRVEHGTVAAIVDSDGRFIARNVNYQSRVGQPATAILRDALRQAPSGLYHGRTYEGFENYTAYRTSALTGWSTHIAVASALINRPQTYTIVAIALGALIACGLAAGLIAYALNDMAQRRRAEERMAQMQKLEAIGQLTGGVAHDFNNLLTVIIGGLGMLLKRIQDPQQRWIAENMLDAAKRGDKLTKQLLAFSRGQRLELAPVDLNALVQGMDDLLRRSIGDGVTFTLNLSPNPCWVRSDANQLELAILNLAINSRDAMPNGGHIDIVVRPAPRDPNSVELLVTDNGIGMPKDVIERAIEPFFTTKPAGKGTGLGLAQVYGAMRQSGGALDIESAPDRGATIRLTLPRTAPPPEPAAAPAPADTAGAPRSGRILVVDDEPGVRSFMTETLREAGYDAEDAADVGIALARLETDPPDLLLTDYSMPGMNGLELAERGRAKTPGLKVLIVSGYADAAALEKSAALPSLLRKPFDDRALIDAVAAVLQ